MSEDVSNRLLELRNFYVQAFRENAKQFGFRPETLAQQVYLALSAVDAKPFIEDVDAAAYTPKENPSETSTRRPVRRDRPVVPEDRQPPIPGDGPTGN